MTATLENADAFEFVGGIKEGSIDLILTDPPYGISRATGFEKSGANGVDRLRVSMDFGEWDKVDPRLDLILPVMYKALRKGGTMVMFYDLWKISELADIIKKYFKMLRFIEWVKTNPVPLNASATYLSNAREVAIVAVKGGTPTFNAYYHNGIFSYPIHRDGGKRVHPTQKPLVLMRALIELHSDTGDTVLDPYAGSATTLVAAQDLGRNAIGCEIDPVYYERAKRRLNL